MKKAYLFLAAAFLLGVFEGILFRPLLPDPMAIHFDVAGRVDGWGARDRFLLDFAAAPVVLVLLFGALRLILPRVPASLINLPNKDYWLAPVRRAQTFERMSEHAAVLVALALLLVDALLYQALRAARSESLSPGWLWGSIGIFVAASAVWAVGAARIFRLPKAGT